ncbi:MAG: signal peptidase I [Candidatus Bathycorpusculaceae bacterium]
MEGKTLTATFKKLWKNEYVQTALMLVLMVAIVFGFWYASQLALGTQNPMLAVVTGSMCTIQGGQCDGWTHPFEHTLHIGDLIVIQGVKPEEINDDYPESDIIVFHKPINPEELIVHRVVAKEERDGKTYFRTKGDGNGIHKWPEEPETAEYDPWIIPEELVVGKVVLRIPWIGHITLFMHNSIGLPIVLFLIILVIAVEFVVPILKGKGNVGTEKP